MYVIVIYLWNPATLSKGKDAYTDTHTLHMSLVGGFNMLPVDCWPYITPQHSTSTVYEFY